jgi:tetratricopeptide (TPR) repeat protein
MDDSAHYFVCGLSVVLGLNHAQIPRARFFAFPRGWRLATLPGMKAFLSHSSTDKQFVAAVATELKRQYSVYDEASFDTGVEFKTSIERGLKESSIFVLFVTRASLASLWVEFEIREAWYLTLQNKLNESLVYILDSSIEISDLPEWLRRSKVRRVTAPKTVAREIRDHLDALVRHNQSPFFIGRTKDIEALQRLAVPLDGSIPPQVIVVSGLPGIGRRALIRQICRPLLNLNRVVVMPFEEGDDISDVAIKMADLVEPYSTRGGFERIVADIRSGSSDKALERIITDLRIAMANGELPIFFDDGGMLNEDGQFKEVPRRIFSALHSSIHLFIVSPRRPNQGAVTPFPALYINALTSDECKTLIASLANRCEMRLSAAEISELAEYTGGLPPACSFAIELVKNYGIDLVISEKRRLVEFRTGPFIKYLTARNLSSKQADILMILAAYSPLPLQVLGHAIEVSRESMSEVLIKLLDYSLVVTDIRGFYSIAEPIKDAVTKMSRFVLRNEHSAVAHSLKNYLDNLEQEEPQLELLRVLFRAAHNANEKELASEILHLANDIIRLAESHYYSRDYTIAVTFAREAVSMRPGSVTARSFLIRGLIQEAQWAEAEREIEEYRKYAPLRDVYFLEGFLARKRGSIREAVRLFEQSERVGRRGGAVKRELAFCYYLLGDLPRAAQLIEAILEDHWDEPFIVDFAVQLATKQGNEALARNRIQKLAAIDSLGFYMHRLSRVELHFGHIQEAREAAEKAVQSETRPTFEMFSQLAVCEMKLGNFNEAERLIAELDKRFQRVKPVVRVNLKGLLEISRRHYSAALNVLSKQSDTHDQFYMQLRRDALRGELETSALTDAVRGRYEAELGDLEHKLTSRGGIDIGDLLDD